MGIQVFGALLAVNILPDTARISRKRNGLLEGECTFECIGAPGAAGQTLDAALPFGLAHPYNTNIWMETKQIVYHAKGATAVCTYAGVEFEFLEKPVYETIIGVEESPIETHPNFQTIAGKPSSPTNGAIFLDPSTGYISTDDTVGVFDRFAPYVGGSINPKAGIEAFLDPVYTYRQSYVTQTPPDDSGVGTIQTPPGPGIKGIGKRTWLYTGMNSRRRGDPSGQINQIVYEVSKDWKLSGRRGWDTDIYTSS